MKTILTAFLVIGSLSAVAQTTTKKEEPVKQTEVKQDPPKKVVSAKEIKSKKLVKPKAVRKMAEPAKVEEKPTPKQD